MSRSTKNKKKLKIRKNGLLYKLILVTCLLIVVLNILRYAAYLKKEDNTVLRVMIQNKINPELEHDVYIDENSNIYFSEADMKEYFDKELYYENIENNKRKYFSLVQNKILEIIEDENYIKVNNQQINIQGKLHKRKGTYYFPISELTHVYNLEVDYIAENNRLNIEKLSNEKTTAIVNRDTKLKYKMTNISKTIKQLQQGDKLTVIEEMNDKWVRVKTADYEIGYVKKSKLLDFEKEREALNVSNQYFSDFNIERDIIIEPNDSIYENFNEKISTYDGRKAICDELSQMMIKEITDADLSEKYIGIKIKKLDIQKPENYYKFLEELRVYANSNGCFVIVEKADGLNESKLKEVTDVVI